jgi:hypothetical protein
LNEEVKAVVGKMKGIGQHLTFEGEYVADFIERLDKIIEVKGVKLDGDKLQILVGEPKTAIQEDILRVVTKASLLNVSASGYEDKSYGKVLYFEYYIPPWQGLHL